MRCCPSQILEQTPTSRYLQDREQLCVVILVLLFPLRGFLSEYVRFHPLSPARQSTPFVHLYVWARQLGPQESQFRILPTVLSCSSTPPPSCGPFALFGARRAQRPFSLIDCAVGLCVSTANLLSLVSLVSVGFSFHHVGTNKAYCPAMFIVRKTPTPSREISFLCDIARSRSLPCICINRST